MHCAFQGCQRGVGLARLRQNCDGGDQHQSLGPGHTPAPFQIQEAGREWGRDQGFRSGGVGSFCPLLAPLHLEA